MCGIVGYIQLSRVNHWQAFIKPMSQTISHRGPDCSGSWFDKQKGIALGHQRLSILDLSMAGKQPMISKSGRYVIIFNGEIYNHKDIRNQINLEQKSIQWRGHSDTETLLAAFEQRGIEKTLDKLKGMFAISLFDKAKDTLFLMRDRIGEKPLYYGYQNHGGQKAFMFASELKALKKHPSFSGEIDRNALSLLMRFNYIPAPHSIYKGIKKLLPGHLLEIKLSDLNNGRSLVSRPYWSLTDCIKTAQSNLYQGSEASAKKKT